MLELDNWQRIEKIVKWSGASSVNAFAHKIGLNRGENLYQIKRGNNGISKELAELITSKHPEVSKAWILTGEGDMLIRNINPPNMCSAIPFFNMDAISVVRSHEPLRYTHSYSIVIPDFRDCDFAALWFGDAMSPFIPHGSIVIFKKIEKEYIRPGDEYLVVSSIFDGIRRIRKDPEATQLRLEPRNREDFDDILIDPEAIEKIYQVKGVIIKKN